MSMLLKISGSESELFDPIPGRYDPAAQTWSTGIVKGPIELSGRTSTYPTWSQTTSAPPEMNDNDQDDQEQDPDPE